ncbi:type IV pilus biogenesis/stability protein PilW, partial [Candidatus Omnitrophota bacterium]
MKKQKTLLVKAGFLAVVVFLVLGATIYGQGTLNDARKLMDKGQYRLSDAVFRALVQKDSQKADTWYWWGVCQVKQGYQADKMFLKAVGLKPKFSKSIAPLYRQEAESFLQNGQTDTARGLFDKAIEWDKDLRPEIAQYIFDSGQYELAVHYDSGLTGKVAYIFFDSGQYKLAVRYDSGLADKVADIFYVKGEVLNCKDALSYFREARQYSSKHNEAIKDKLLAKSRTMFEEKDIRFWRDAAAEFGSIPPDFKVYEPGTYTFSLKAGEKTDHWITFPLGILLGYSISSKNYGYKLLYDDGEVVKDGEKVKYPHKTIHKFKLLAISDQPEITMT